MASIIDLYTPSMGVGGEKELLHLRLQLEREALVWKLEDLPEADRRRPLTSTGTTLIGLVKHLIGVESAYFCDAFGRSRPPLAWESDEEASYGEFSDMYAKPEETTEAILTDYGAATAAADASIAELDLETTGRHHTGVTVSLRWMLLTVLVDTARHAGHADILREQIDGATGGHPSWPGRLDEDPEYRRTYLARVRGEISTADWFAYLRARRAPAGGETSR